MTLIYWIIGAAGIGLAHGYFWQHHHILLGLASDIIGVACTAKAFRLYLSNWKRTNIQ